jgi:folate-binding protein YgfZ
VSEGHGLPGGYGALRHGVGAHRLALDAVVVRGPQAGDYLQGQLSQDLSGIGVGGAAPALLLEPDGKLTALVRALRTGDDEWVLDTDAGFGETVLSRLRRFRLRTKADIEPVEWPGIALRGAGVAAALSAPRAGRPTGPPWTVPVEWNGTSGVDLLGAGADDLVPAAASWCDDGAWESLRVEAGIPRMGAELDERTIAAEAGLVERTVSFTKGCYTGQELVARLDARGSRVARRLCGVVAPGVTEQDAARLVGAALWRVNPDAGGDGERPVGRCTSAAWCPGVGALGALAYLHRSVGLPAELTWSPVEAAEADAPGTGPVRHPASARELPLVAS